MPLHVSSTSAYRQEAKIGHTVSGINTPIGVMIPETVQYNFVLLTMSTCARNM